MNEFFDAIEMLYDEKTYDFDCLDGNELKNLHSRNVDGEEHFDIAYGKKNIQNDGDFYFIGSLFEMYGDRHFYKNMKTGEIVSHFVQIGE